MMDAKLSSIKESLKRLEKIHGPGIAMQLGSSKPQEVECFSTGSLSLDYGVLGCGGIPRGRITEAFGPDGVGKSTLLLQTIAQANLVGERAVYIDVENALDIRYAEKLGVNVKELIVSQPDYGEQALSVAEEFITAGSVGIVVVDSVAMLTPKAELEGEIGDAPMASQARLMTQALRKLTGLVRKSRVALVFINQLRDKIGGVSWGSTEMTPGGRALRHNASVRLDVRRIQSLKNGEKIVGARTRIKAVKNKVANPFRDCELDLYYGEGISCEADLLDRGAEFGVLEKSGANYSFKGERLGLGRENARLFLCQQPELSKKIRSAVQAVFLERMRNGSGVLSQ